MTNNDTNKPETQTEASAARCAVASGSARTPLMRAYSHDDAVNVAKQWMRDNYGIPRELSEESRASYHEKLGLLIDFLGTLHPPEPSPNDQSSATRTNGAGRSL